MGLPYANCIVAAVTRRVCPLFTYRYTEREFDRMKRNKILVLTRSAFGKRISSPGIRAHHMADVLARHLPEAEVTMAIPATFAGDFSDLPYNVVPYGRYASVGEMRHHDIIISNGFPPHSVAMFPQKTFILDFFTQHYIEWMENTKDKSSRRNAWMTMARSYLNMQLTFADFVVCANERQRDTFIGSLIALDLINPAAYDSDPSLRALIDIAPHGVRTDERKQGKPVLKGVYGGIRETDKVLLWHGGILQWYDPPTLLRAVAKIREIRDDVKLVFVGALYPGLRSLGFGKRFEESVELARELGLYNSTVFFDIGWVPYEEIKDYLLEADLAVCTYFNNMETRYSHRTRFVDAFWAELPMICTRGDVLAELIDERGLGLVVEQGDVDGVADAILKLLDDEELNQRTKDNIREANKEMIWDVAFEPLVRFCREGTSIARPKRERIAPLTARAARYVTSSLLLGGFK